VAVASAGPYASLHLAPDKITTPAPHTLFLQAGCPSCRPTNSVKALKVSVAYDSCAQRCPHKYEQFLHFSVVGFRLFFVRVQFVFSVFIVSLKVCRVRLPVMF